MSATDGRRKMLPGQAPAPPPTKKKGVKVTRDEELALFAEMHKRERDRLGSLLQPVSDDSIEGYSLYHKSTVHGNVLKVPSQSSFSNVFPAEKFDNKNDYDWLKTPPATPLFPSLEIEAGNGHTLVVQRELPILQPLSRFSGNNNSSKTPTKKIADQASSVATKGKAPPRLRSTTPTPRFPTVSPSSSQERTTNNISKLAIKSSQRMNKSLDNYNTDGIKIKHMTNINGSSLSRSMGEGKSLTTESKAKAKAKATFPTNVPDEMTKIPSNLRTSGRSYSASRGRPGLVITNNQKTTNPVLSNCDHILGTKTGSYCDDDNNSRKPTMKSRQSCSPSVTRGRKPAAAEQLARQDNNSKTNNGVIGRTGTQFVGSKMVEKIMNARNMKSNVGTTNNKFA